MSRAHFAFAAHPDAIADLRELPDDIRDLALLELQNLVHGSDDCLPLNGRLAGFHKVYVDPAVSYRMVIQFRPSPPTSTHKREIYLVAAGAREDYAVYRTAQRRTNRTDLNRPAVTDPAAEVRVQAARSRSPHAVDQTASLPATAPAAVSPTAPAASRKAPQR
ncbi:hypothetical protein [Streptomyces sp. NPDC055681]